MAYIGKQPTPVPLSASDLDDDIISLAKMAGGTDGNLITYDASGNPVAVATGNDGQILTSAGAGNPCLFEAAPSGGKVLQVVSATTNSTLTSTANAWVDLTGVTLAITPAATSSKIWVLATLPIFSNGGVYVYCTIMRDSTNLGQATTGFGRADSIESAGNENHTITPVSYLDSPSSTSELTYKVQIKTNNGGTHPTNTSTSVITAFEIGA